MEFPHTIIHVPVILLLLFLFLFLFSLLLYYIYSEKCTTLVYLSASPPLFRQGGQNLVKFRVAQHLKLAETESSNATHRVSPAGRRPPAAGKLAVGAARRIGGDERGGA